ncbi:DUF2938 domain-containing protein [Acinetobacter sp. CFCC 10889]|uniref:DUF2938 domain-containing protein n=1 Tax=Acinetobacter sp. CFCC 10889 TaxID=1775557 RepID=UPI000DD02B96|nr:DUF2938 domain-containing protein [Acinetobacter sp. CFCC 10889]
MNIFIVSFDVIFIGVIATLIIDIYSFLLNKYFKIPSLNYAIVGRWLLIFIKTRQLRHQNIQLAPLQNLEIFIGWMTHYLIGIFFAVLFILIMGMSWLQQPDLCHAILFGMSTTLFPFLIMQPCFGIGFFAAKTTHPWQARLKSCTVHLLFGIGLFLSAQLLNN